MSDEKDNTTTPHQVPSSTPIEEQGRLWRDPNIGHRGHKLMTKGIGEKIPALRANENAADPDAVLAPAKLFSPYNGWRWYITEWDAETGLCFGLVEGLDTELGYFSLTELAETTVLGGVPAIERDLYWEPKTIGEIRGRASPAA